MSNREEVKPEDIHHKTTRIGAGMPPMGTLIPTLEAYNIQREIGRGGMAVVYEAVEKSLNRIVALKVLSKELSHDTDLIRRFVNEAQAAARLTHANIVQIYSIGEEKGIYYFAMEYVRGQSVESMLAEGKKMPVLQCINIVRQTVLALHEAYKNNIVHRDVKPGNLLITEQGIVKVADFGLAAEVKGAPAVVGGKIVGTPLYISPEQAQGRGGDYRSDMYSLGIAFYQMLTGILPYVSSNTQVLMKSHIEKPLLPLPTNVPASVRKLVYRMTDKNPERRFPDYETLIKELDRVYKILSFRKYTLPILSMGLVLSIAITIYSFHYKPMIGGLVLPVEIEKQKRIEAIYKDVVEYARRHPEAYNDVIKEYYKIMKEYPDTEWAFRAERKADMIILAVASEAAEELKGLKSLRDKLIGEKRYGEAVDKYKGVKSKYKDTVAESFAQENIDYIMKKAREDFSSREEQARSYLNQYMFNGARKLYEEVINVFGLSEFTKEAQDKLKFIDELEKEYKIESEAKNLFKPVQVESERLLAEYRYTEARQLLLAIEKTEENPILGELVKKELARIDEMQIEYESTLLKEKMGTQYNIYGEINKKVGGFIADYKYKEAIALVEEGMERVEILEWRSKLEVLKERLGYLVLLKNGVIEGINKELADKNVTNVSANEDTLIFVVKGGYVGAYWKESSPQKIYQIAQNYLRNGAKSHLALGVFCLTYGLSDSARKEFTVVLRMKPQMQGVVEKYLIQLAETTE